MNPLTLVKVEPTIVDLSDEEGMGDFPPEGLEPAIEITPRDDTETVNISGHPVISKVRCFF